MFFHDCFCFICPMCSIMIFFAGIMWWVFYLKHHMQWLYVLCTPGISTFSFRSLERFKKKQQKTNSWETSCILWSIEKTLRTRDAVNDCSAMTPCSVLLPSYVSSHFTPSDQPNTRRIWSYTLSVRYFFLSLRKISFLESTQLLFPSWWTRDSVHCVLLIKCNEQTFLHWAFWMIKYLLLTLKTEATYGNISS